MIENGKHVYIGKDLPNEYTHSKTTERLGKERRFAKQKAAPGIGEMVEIATNERWESPVHKEKHAIDAKYGFYKYDTRFAVNGREGEYEIYDAELVIRHDEDGKLYLYDVQGIKKDTAKVRLPLDESQPDLLSEESKATTNGTSINNISQTGKKDNGKSYSFKGIDDENVKYSIREDDPPKKTAKGYKVFVVKNGKLYPPMVANPGGADTPVGVWLDADEGVRAGESKTGRPQVKAGGKGTQGGSGKLAYRPGWHLGEAPMATQFARLNKETGEKELFPENFVWAECEVAADHDYQDEAMSYGYSENGKFRHAYAGLPRIPKDGMYRYRTNPDPSTVPWIISGSMKVTKVLSDAEVDEILRSNATVSETAPEDKSKLWVDSSDGDTLKYWYGSKKEWRKAPVVRKGGEKTLEELGIAKDPDIRFSFAGDSALNADNKMLQKAKEMYNDFESSESIRKETGWHLGADGKWRFEIDDSQMKVFTSGDALFRKEHPEYTRLQELYDKFWKGDISDAEQKELTELNQTWGGELARLRTRLQRGNARLVDIIQHDVLFENYPQLENVRVILVENLDRATGAYVVNDSEIRIDEDLFKNKYQEAKRNGTLIHEIQHAIQDIEGFAMGANFNMIDAAISATEDEVKAADEHHETAADNLLDALDEAGYFNKYGEDIDVASEEELNRIRSEYEKTNPDILKLVDEFKDSRDALEKAQSKLRELKNMSAVDFYKYAAGEIEARDTASRINYSEAERSATRPDIDSPSIQVEDYVRFSLKNENLSPDARIPYTVHQSYISVKKNDNAALKNLQDSVRKLKRGTYENKATGYKADINGRTVGKILNPSHNMKHAQWSKKYIENLNAAAYLPELFENAVYVDTKENQKSKKANQQIQGYHHFVAPIYMDDKEYRVRIVAREKQNSDTLYIVETEIMTIKDGVRKLPGQKPRNLGATPSDISIPELVNGVKIYDYNMQKNDIYNHNDIKYSMPDEASVIDYMNEQETEFVDLTGFRDYEVKAKQVRQQTYGELMAQVEKLKNDKRFTKGKVLDESSVREEINDMIVTLMSYSESYNSLGVRKKTDHKLVREGVNAAKQIFTAMKKGDVSDVVTKAELAAQQIVENLKLVEDTAYVEYKDLRGYLRTTRMMISEEDAADIPDFKQFKKSNFGRIRIVSQNGIPVDTAYQELTERYPELFSDEITHPADMLRAIADARESLEPYDIMLSAEETEQLMKQTAQDLIDIAATGKAWKSWADKKKEQYDEKLKMLKQRQQEALRDVKKKERDRADKKLEKERQKGKERLEKAKDKAREKS